MLMLRVLKDGAEIKALDLDQFKKDEIIVGRNESADIRLADRSVGREHAVFNMSADVIYLKKKSKFGKMSVNGQEVTQAQIKPGDLISISDYQFQLESQSKKTVTEVKSSEVKTDSVDGVKNDQNTEQDLDLNSEPLALDSGTKANIEADVASGDALEIENQDGAQENLDAINNNVFVAEGEDRTDPGIGGSVEARLIFSPGIANVDELKIDKNEIVIGRGSTCDIILNDKLASRKHAVIQKRGNRFVLIDQATNNGTFINGTRSEASELSSDDVIKIGNSEFKFEAISQEFRQNEQDLLHVGAEIIEDTAQQIDSTALPMHSGSASQSIEMQNAGNLMSTSDPLLAATATGNSGIAGLDTANSAPKSLVEKFKAQPPIRKILIICGIASILWFLNEEPQKEAPKNVVDGQKKEQAGVSVAKSTADHVFDKLPSERKQFIVNTYQLAKDLYLRKEFDRSIEEIKKVMEVIPEYKDSKLILETAQKALATIQAAEEEKRRLENQERLRKKVADLNAEAQKLVDSGKEKEAKEIFSQVLEIEPDNPSVLRMKQQLEDKEIQMKAEAEAKKEKEFKISQLKKLLEEGHELVSKNKFYDAIEKMALAPSIYTGDQTLLDEAKSIIEESKKLLVSLAEPHLKAARAAFESGDFIKSRQEYDKALEIDDKLTEPDEGIAKIEAVLTERLKRIYIDGITLESYADYAQAHAKFKECFNQATPDNIYHGRCFRRMKRLDLVTKTPPDEGFGIKNGQASGTATTRATSSTSSSDPEMPFLPEGEE